LQQPILLGPQLSQLAILVRDGRDITQAADELGPEVAEIVALVRNAATLADAIDFDDRLHYGSATTVGSIGSLLSGGQKQRIALARALIKDPRILILDEATSSLDSASEQQIQAAIEAFSKGRTLITIAYQLSTVRNTDNIIVMRHGNIVEQGTHAKLIAQNGAYSELVRLQSLTSLDVPEPVSKETAAAEILEKDDSVVGEYANKEETLDSDTIVRHVISYSSTHACTNSNVSRIVTHSIFSNPNLLSSLSQIIQQSLTRIFTVATPARTVRRSDVFKEISLVDY
jgi:ABC-type multidrug transport system ATPase subunit